MNLYKAVAEIKNTVNNMIPDMLIMVVMRSIERNDEAHNLDHVVNVVKHAYELCDRMDLSFKETSMVLTGALCHDLGCAYDRDTHHFISYGLVFDYLERYGDSMFTLTETKIIAESCLQHRASFKGTRNHIVAELVALADRGKLDKREYVKRSIQFHTSRIGRNKEAVIKEVSEHIPDKFGKEGYNWKTYPEIGFRVYQDRVNEFIRFADTPKEVEELILSVMEEMNY